MDISGLVYRQPEQLYPAVIPQQQQPSPTPMGPPTPMEVQYTTPVIPALPPNTSTDQHQPIARFMGPPPISLACTECRSRHLKCDAGVPSCNRCQVERKECSYIKSRRGWKETRRKKAAASAAPAAAAEKEKLAPAPEPSFLVKKLSSNAETKEEPKFGSTGIKEHGQYKLQAEFRGDFVVHTTYIPSPTAVPYGAGVSERVTTRWRRERVIGAGGFGTVWLQKAEDGELRAVKIIPRPQPGTKSIDFSRELDTLAKLRKFESIDSIFIATEYLEHGDLGQYLKKLGPIAEKDAREVTKQLLEGLVVLHENHICHRDLKPQNVLIASTSPLRIKIADFGTSKCQMNTELRTRLGTQGYCAPELMGFVRGSWRSYTHAIDLWALGSLVHEILTAKIPFLENPLDGDDETFSGVGQQTEPPRTDMKRLYEYCQLGMGFPAESLQKSKVSEEGINFVKGLLVVDPRGRMPAADALESPWLQEYQSVLRLQRSVSNEAVYGSSRSHSPRSMTQETTSGSFASESQGPTQRQIISGSFTPHSQRQETFTTSLDQAAHLLRNSKKGPTTTPNVNSLDLSNSGSSMIFDGFVPPLENPSVVSPGSELLHVVDGHTSTSQNIDGFQADMGFPSFAASGMGLGAIGDPASPWGLRAIGDPASPWGLWSTTRSQVNTTPNAPYHQACHDRPESSAYSQTMRGSPTLNTTWRPSPQVPSAYTYHHLLPRQESVSPMPVNMATAAFRQMQHYTVADNVYPTDGTINPR